MPKISTGEIWDIEVVGNRVFIAGNFTSIQNQRPGNTTTYQQAGIASYNLTTGLVDTDFRPTIGGGGVDSVEATPDGTKLFITGSFTTVNGVSKRGLARLDINTGARRGRLHRLALSARHRARRDQHDRLRRWSVHYGEQRPTRSPSPQSTRPVRRGRHRVRQQPLRRHRRQRRARACSGSCSPTTMRKLLVVHTGRQVNGQDRYGIALINTATKELAPWRTRLCRGQPAVRRRHPADLRRRHRAGRRVVRRDQRLGWRPSADQRHRHRLQVRRGRRRPAALDLPALRQRLLDRDHREGCLRRRSLRVAGVAHGAGPVAGPGRRRLRHRPGPLRLLAG